MALTKSILIVIFSLMCVIGGTLSPYTIAGVNEKEVTENKIDITLPEYEDVSMSEPIPLTYSVSQKYSFSVQCGVLGSEVYDYHYIPCSENSESHVGFDYCCDFPYEVTFERDYDLIGSDVNGNVISSEPRKLILNYILNSASSLDVTLKIYASDDLLIKEVSVQNVSYQKHIFNNTTGLNYQKNVFSSSLNVENVYDMILTCEVYDMSYGSYSHIHSHN